MNYFFYHANTNYDNGVNMNKDNKNTKTKVDKSSKLIMLTILGSALVLSALLLFGLFMDNGYINTGEFYDNTSVNGINVSGLSKEEVASLISSKLVREKDDIGIELKYEDKTWNLSGQDFETNSNIFPIIEQTYAEVRNGVASQKISKVKKLKNEGLNYNISYRYILGDFDKKIDDVISKIECEACPPCVNFDPSKEGDAMFTAVEGACEIKVDKAALYNEIDNAFKTGSKISVEVPVTKVDYTSDIDVFANTKLRSKFSTGYKGSAQGRRNNVLRALSDFNGMVVNPGEEISFNDVTGDKTPEKGYMKANIILNGIYVEDYGGGACQASTTLYNALILSDIEILEVHPHSLPVSYVPLAFDAMVSEGYSDFRFKNNFEHPIYIKTYGDDENAFVEIYGEPLAEGQEIRRRAEFIETLPHDGDMIVKDEKGEYSDKVTYVGEYYRVKKPSEGYHSKGYLQYWQDGEMVDEKLIRDEYYYPQRGIIVEGTEPLGEGMTLPENQVKIIPPQEKSKISEVSVKKKIDAESPANLNP